MWDLWEIQARILLIYGLKSPSTYFGPRLMQKIKLKNRNKGQIKFNLLFLFSYRFILFGANHNRIQPNYIYHQNRTNTSLLNLLQKHKMAYRLK